MLPVPAENTAVKVADVPAVMGLAPAAKLVMNGAATTPTVAVVWTDVPAIFVTVSV
jgi:hypothetical protein